MPTTMVGGCNVVTLSKLSNCIRGVVWRGVRCTWYHTGHVFLHSGLPCTLSNSHDLPHFTILSELTDHLHWPDTHLMFVHVVGHTFFMSWSSHTCRDRSYTIFPSELTTLSVRVLLYFGIYAVASPIWTTLAMNVRPAR
jgi:hypothetical protein